MPVDLPVLVAALLSGALGGLHCVAMCGGLATGLSACGPAGHGGRTALLLNLGRVGGYVIAGVVVGALGAGLLGLVRGDGMAQALRAAVGLVMVGVAVRMWRPRWFAGARPARLGAWRALQWLRARCVPASGPLRPLLLGLFWGWLPCGLSTMLLAAAWLQGSALHGGLVMLAFGLGTLPLLTLLSWTGARGAALLGRPGWRHAAAGVVFILGLVTLAAPALAHVPEAHGVLAALGCRGLG
jgi:sulfite exporter TauE/SafE